jgi:HSP20 family molecular chaperone IbpA
VDKLYKDCLHFSEALMKNLLTLDAISTSEKSRPLRKQQVSTIQDLLSNMDNIKEKLSEYKKHLSEDERIAQEEAKLKAAEEEKEEVAKSKADAEEQQEQLQKEEKKKPLMKHSAQQQEPKQIDIQFQEDEEEEQELDQIPRIHAEKWASLKLKPNFDISQSSEAFEISGFIPGINEKDLKISLSDDNDVMTISGVRLPTADEELELQRQLIRRIQMASGGMIREKIPPQLLQSKILQMGSGRFGSFSESYRLPDSANFNAVNASYEKGVLRITIPKRVRKLSPRQKYYDPYESSMKRGFGYPQGGHPFGYSNAPRGFFGNRDSWW